MSFVIVVSILLGGIFGYLAPQEIMGFEEKLVDPLIYGLIFMSGLSIGYDVNIRKTIKKTGAWIVLTPISIIIGSIIGGIVAGTFLGFSVGESSAIASGLGWYSLSAIMIGKYDNVLGAFSLLSNIFRELMAFVFIPIVAKHIGYIEAIAPCGATSMDTTLGAITSVTDDDTGLVAFANGVILTMCVPPLVQFFISIVYSV